MAVKLRAWLYDRTQLRAESFGWLNRPVRSGGWASALGPVALMLLVVLAATGIFLAMYYAPHPQSAYESTRYLDREVLFGRLVRGLHHYSTSGLVIVLVMHLVHTYARAAYKAPRELTWVSGVLLLVLVLGFAITGDLLPWDMKAFFGAQVRTMFPESLPLVGPALVVLARGGAGVGAMTLTRFYALHTLLLPVALVGVLLPHFLLAWRRRPAPLSASEDAAPMVERYGDRQVFRDAFAAFLVFAVIFLLSILQPVSLEFRANRGDATYHPHPEWFLLFLYQFLNDFGGAPVVGDLPDWVATLLIPGVAVTVLLLAPWIDRGPERSLARRPLMAGLLAVGLLWVGGFTLRAYALLRHNATPTHSLYAHYTDRGQDDLEPTQLAAGKEAFAACSGCHRAYRHYTTGSMGPDLTNFGRTTFLMEMEGHPEVSGMNFHKNFVDFVRGELRTPNTRMPRYTPEMLPQEKLDAIGAYLSQDSNRVKD